MKKKRNDRIIDIKFSEEYENMIKRTHYYSLIFIIGGICFVIIIDIPLFWGIILMSFMIVLSIYSYYGMVRGEGYIPTKVRINDEGLYAWKRNGTEEMIKWEQVKSIKELKEKNSPGFMMLYKSKKSIPKGNHLFFHEIVLDYNSGQIANGYLTKCHFTHQNLIPDSPIA